MMWWSRKNTDPFYWTQCRHQWNTLRCIREAGHREGHAAWQVGFDHPTVWSISTHLANAQKSVSPIAAPMEDAP